MRIGIIIHQCDLKVRFPNSNDIAGCNFSTVDPFLIDESSIGTAEITNRKDATFGMDQYMATRELHIRWHRDIGLRRSADLHGLILVQDIPALLGRTAYHVEHTNHDVVATLSRSSKTDNHHRDHASRAATSGALDTKPRKTVIVTSEGRLRKNRKLVRKIDTIPKSRFARAAQCHPTSWVCHPVRKSIRSISPPFGSVQIKDLDRKNYANFHSLITLVDDFLRRPIRRRFRVRPGGSHFILRWYCNEKTRSDRRPNGALRDFQ